MLLAVEMAGIMVPSAKMVITHCTVQFFWLIFQVCLCFTLGANGPLYFIFCLSFSARNYGNLLLSEINADFQLLCFDHFTEVLCFDWLYILPQPSPFSNIYGQYDH